MSARRSQVARGVRELAVELLYRVSVAQSGLTGGEETAERIEALQDPRTRKRWAEDAQRLRAHVRRHDALQGPLVAVVGRHAPSALSAVLAIVERAAGLVALEDWRGLSDLEWGVEETELLARLDQELAALSVGRKAKPTERRRPQSLDELAMGAVRLFENPDDPKYRPNWTVADVARELGVEHSRLVGRQRDGSPRCPQFTKHRAKNGRSPVTRRRGRV